jgi:Rrf2 family protein
MRLSTKGRYGVRFLMDLVLHNAAGNVTLREVAQRQEISEKYLWQIVSPLKKAGLIRAVAGPGGGYALARPPASITLRDILVVLEGDFSLAPCTQEPQTCARSAACAPRAIWQEVDEKIAVILKSVTLKTMADRQQAMLQKQTNEYSI